MGLTGLKSRCGQGRVSGARGDGLFPCFFQLPGATFCPLTKQQLFAFLPSFCRALWPLPPAPQAPAMAGLSPAQPVSPDALCPLLCDPAVMGLRSWDLALRPLGLCGFRTREGQRKLFLGSIPNTFGATLYSSGSNWKQ